MPDFSKRSNALLDGCHPDLGRLFREVVRHFDCTILPSTLRTVEEQREFVRTGASKTMNSKHLPTPEHPYSRAVDAVPYPIDWSDAQRMLYFGGFVMGVASQMGIRVRWGHDWDGDTDLRDQTFNDGPHFELIDP